MSSSILWAFECQSVSVCIHQNTRRTENLQRQRQVSKSTTPATWASLTWYTGRLAMETPLSLIFLFPHLSLLDPKLWLALLTCQLAVFSYLKCRLYYFKCPVLTLVFLMNEWPRKVISDDNSLPMVCILKTVLRIGRTYW